MTKDLIQVIYKVHEESKNASKEYKQFCEFYVGLLIQEKPQNEHERYYNYWKGLKNEK